ncbi:hypothetical protein HNP84_006504 [Thermocatellispora tengchongensis]|uniref:Uncharacterized protein n=1 Tax=Thermocatellispora tengchongensis TaxID=1073253 RepID=A0A840PFM9_9ACTN|nr:hypothetical protein [Thermocatellispora tengchongensis]MBB5136753.1 hypothetical protein [Thermocatellispora tengchongensis]
MSSDEGEHDYSQAFDLEREMTPWQTRLYTKFLENDREPGFPRRIYQITLFTLQFWLPDEESAV